jgi:tetratricopeptide (TPR) repeat protein
VETKLKPIEPPDSHFLKAADGWLELGNWLEANEELEQITPTNRAHPAVLFIRYEVYSKAQKWDDASEIAGTLVKILPEQLESWICFAYATRRKTNGGIPIAKEILTEANGKFPKEYLISFNLACYECQLGNLRESIQWLKKAIELGGKKDIRLMALEDDDLKPLWEQIGSI